MAKDPYSEKDEIENIYIYDKCTDKEEIIDKISSDEFTYLIPFIESAFWTDSRYVDEFNESLVDYLRKR